MPGTESRKLVEQMVAVIDARIHLALGADKAAARQRLLQSIDALDAQTDSLGSSLCGLTERQLRHFARSGD